MRAVYWNSHEKLYAVFSVPGLWILYRWNLESSCEILWRHLLDVCKLTTHCLAEHVAPCWVTAVTHSAFSVVQTEQARSTNIFITLSQTLKLSTYFKLALCEGFLPCCGTSNSYQRHICTCTMHIVSNKFSQQKYDDPLSISPWLLNCIPRCVCATFAFPIPTSCPQQWCELRHIFTPHLV
jgi:hypothetical protein